MSYSQLPTRTSADLNSAADVNQLQANIEALKGGEGSTAPTTDIETLASDKLDKSTFDANTILKADTDNTPSALTVAEQTMIGRITGGNIAALTPAQIIAMLNAEQYNATNYKTFSSSTSTSISSPVSGTIYNPSGHSLTLPAGTWEIHWEVFIAGAQTTAAAIRLAAGIGTASNNFSASGRKNNRVESTTAMHGCFSGTFIVTITTSTTYYLNILIASSNAVSYLKTCPEADSAPSVILAKRLY